MQPRQGATVVVKEWFPLTGNREQPGKQEAGSWGGEGEGEGEGLANSSGK